jgi:LmbE family N-acetylglucosaminyl deacetylase
MRTEPALIALLPHPDDEFAILPLLARAHAEGRATHLVWLTDGAFGGVDPEVRRQESLRALRSVGVQPHTLVFVGIDGGIPDGRLHLSMAEAHTATIAALDAVDGPAELLLPAWEGGHQDHDAAHALGRAVARSRGFHALQYPLYQGEGLRGPVFRALAPLRASTVVRALPVGWTDIGRLVRACLHYRSQWRSFVGLLPNLITYHFYCWFGVGIAGTTKQVQHILIAHQQGQLHKVQILSAVVRHRYVDVQAC